MPVEAGQIRTTNPSVSASPYAFFLLVSGLSIPFYALGMAGGRLAGLTAQPTSALMAFVPMAAALILVYRRRGASETATLALRAIDVHRVRHVHWYLAAVCLLPIAATLQYAVLRLTGTVLPPPIYAIDEIPVFIFLYFIGAIGEELGWQGYAFPALRSRCRTIPAALILGAFWSIWHVIPFIQIGHTTVWIVWHCLSIVALRVIIVWLVTGSGGSIFIAVLYHMMINLPWSVIVNYGAFYNPFINFVILLLMAGLIIIFWHPPNDIHVQ